MLRPYFKTSAAAVEPHDVAMRVHRDGAVRTERLLTAMAFFRLVLKRTYNESLAHVRLLCLTDSILHPYYLSSTKYVDISFAREEVSDRRLLVAFSLTKASIVSMQKQLG